MTPEKGGGKKSKAGGKASEFARRLERGGVAPASPESGTPEAASVAGAVGASGEVRPGARSRRSVTAREATDGLVEKRVRITVDASREQHRRLKIFAMDAETDAMSVMRALLDELDSNPALAARIMDRLAEDA